VTLALPKKTITPTLRCVSSINWADRQGRNVAIEYRFTDRLYDGVVPTGELVQQVRAAPIPIADRIGASADGHGGLQPASRHLGAIDAT
jgi:hypothetical protein